MLAALVWACPWQARGAQDHGAHAQHAMAELGTGAAFDRAGKLWAVGKESAESGSFVVVRHSTDLGQTWSQARRVHATPEPVVARGQAHPKIAFGARGEMYIAYTTTVARPHIGDIRFVRSLDGGASFSAPITVHADRQVITHSFESMVIDREGRIFIAWIDGRDKTLAKATGRPYAGSAIYYAVSTDQGASFTGDYKVADHSCECCRLALALNASGKPVLMWRHVFAPNARDHAIAELSADGSVSPVTRVSFEDWRVDACPHHGPSLAYDADGTRHQVWFNIEGGQGAVYYARAKPGDKPARKMRLGSAQAKHADIAVDGKNVVLAWQQFDGNATAIVTKTSSNGGRTWHQRELARTDGQSDQPRLVPSHPGVVLVWHTEKEGMRVLPVQTESRR